MIIGSEKTKNAIIPEKDLFYIREKYKYQSIILGTGCFDLLHSGHLYFLKVLKDNADIVIIGINGNAAVKKIKGISRPICSEYERANLVSAIQYVDYVYIFNSTSAEESIQKLRPEIFAIGEESINSYPQEIEAAKKINASILVVKRQSGSTTDIIKKIQNIGKDR